MARKPELIVRLAITNGVARCVGSQAQFTSLQDFTEQLEEQGWDRETIARVERGVIAALAAASRDTTRQGDT